MDRTTKSIENKRRWEALNAWTRARIIALREEGMAPAEAKEKAKAEAAEKWRSKADVSFNS